MFDEFSVVAALFIAVVLAAAFAAWLWLVRRKQAEAVAGLEALSGMRWREFSRLVIEALKPRGFAAESVEDSVERGQQADIRLNREGRPWLLSCKQGSHYVITASVVREFNEAIRFNGAAGGLLVTPGQVDPEARKAAPGIELYDGKALWTLVKPLLPPALRDDLTAAVRMTTVRETALASLLAMALGFGLAMLLPKFGGDDAPVVAASGGTPAATSTATAKGTEANANVAPNERAPDDPNREDFERNEVIKAVSALPDVDRVMWSTRSTLLVYLRDDIATERVQEICAILERYETLRISRLHLQPPQGSTRNARFLQCRTN